MRYNALTTPTKLPLATAMTPSELQQAIEANTTAIARLAAASEQGNQAINMLVTQFIRPTAQQALENQQSIAQLIDAIDRHAQAIVGIDERLDRVAQQQETNTEAIAAAIERMTAFDSRLEETRQLVAQNASNAAQNEAKHNAAMDRNERQIATLTEEIATLTEETRAVAEASRTQLAAIIGNGRRIDRLEQQAS